MEAESVSCGGVASEVGVGLNFGDESVQVVKI